MILIGNDLPHMQVQTTDGIKNLPEDYLGNWLILFSHPGDFTPVCTTEFVSFAKNMDTFEQMDTKLLGLSVDQVQPHIKWMEWIEEHLGQKINFPIIADPLGKVAQALEMIDEGNQTLSVRATFIIDPNGKIRMILYYPAEVGRNMDEIIRAVVALQVADEEQVALPANWPHNELIGDQVIIPPATTVEEAQRNGSLYNNYDWWFAYKALE